MTIAAVERKESKSSKKSNSEAESLKVRLNCLFLLVHVAVRQKQVAELQERLKKRDDDHDQLQAELAAVKVGVLLLGA